jgi:signal transduction histidine kinase
MSVEDKGIGFDVKEKTFDSKGKGSLGLISMRERADLIGANLKIESSPGKGATVKVKMPV